MNILILGSGGREHAFAKKLSESKRVLKLFLAPGNAGTSEIAINIPIDPTDFEGVKNIVLENAIGMVVVGPELPLAKGIHDFFLLDEELNGIPVIGPKKDGARLESSKDFSKKFMQKNQIPTSRYGSFTVESIEAAEAFLETLDPPFVLKADGLTSGKGVLILEDLVQAKQELRNMLIDKKFGEASSRLIIEEYLRGIELSVFVLTDGKSYKILPSAKDYKRIGEGDTGLNTGGMGAISPVPFDCIFMEKVEHQIVKSTMEGLKREGIDYRGFIFIGLMNVDGDPFVIEYNVRMGDPETQVVLPRISSDLFDLLEGVAHQILDTKLCEVKDEVATTVVVVSQGYPGLFEKGQKIEGVNQKTDEKSSEKTIIYHSGTALNDGHLIVNGGRVLSVTAFGADIPEALEKSYKRIDKIHFEKMHFRKDIGFDFMKK